jgi:hypothetical protein
MGRPAKTKKTSGFGTGRQRRRRGKR